MGNDSPNNATVTETEDTTTTEEAEETYETPKALLNFESWTEELSPTDLTPDNVRPLNVTHIVDVQNGIRSSNGYDGDIIAMRVTKDANGKDLPEAEYQYLIFDGHHRIAAIVGYENLELGITIPGLLETDAENQELINVIRTIDVKVYDFHEVFENHLDFLKAQFRVNSGRRNISDNAADSSAAIFQMLSEGATPGELKEIIGKSESWISNAKVAHENCAEELKAAVREGLISGKTMIEARNVSKTNQKKMLRDILSATKDLPEKLRTRAERTTANTFISEAKSDTGKTPSFPPSFGRKKFCVEMHQAHGDFIAACSDAKTDPASLKPDTKDPIQKAIFTRGYMQGLLAAHRVNKADRADMALKTLEKHFQTITGHSIDDPDKNDFDV